MKTPATQSPTVLSKDFARKLTDDVKRDFQHLLRPRRSAPARSERANVYVLRSAAGEVLYVGLSCSMGQRLAQHSARPWWHQVSAIELRHCLDRDEASNLERQLIAELRPRYNRNGGGA